MDTTSDPTSAPKPDFPAEFMAAMAILRARSRDGMTIGDLWRLLEQAETFLHENFGDKPLVSGPPPAPFTADDEDQVIAHLVSGGCHPSNAPGFARIALERLAGINPFPDLVSNRLYPTESDQITALLRSEGADPETANVMATAMNFADRTKTASAPDGGDDINFDRHPEPEVPGMPGEDEGTVRARVTNGLQRLADLGMSPRELIQMVHEATTGSRSNPDAEGNDGGGAKIFDGNADPSDPLFEDQP